MDFSNRNVQPQAAAPGAQNTAAGNFNNKKGKRGGDKGKLTRIITVLLVAAVAILIAAVIAVVASGDNTKAESKYVDSSKLQAVFLNTGQVYFGHIASLNDDYLVVTDIYYLQATNADASAANANSNVTLVKLGCELHEPYDQMIINSEQVTFWENLQDNGQVAKAVTAFQKQNPNGQKCADQSSSAPTTSSDDAQNATPAKP